MQKTEVLKEYSKVRRDDRVILDQNWIQSFLLDAPFGVLATVFQGQPFTHVNIYAYDPQKHVIYLHNADQGRTPENISIDERVCFTVAEMGRLLPAKIARNLSVEYSSVVIFGTAEIITDQSEIIYGLQLLINKYFPHLAPESDYSPLDQTQLKGVIVIRINIQEWSAKQKKASTDYPEAFKFSTLSNGNPG